VRTKRCPVCGEDRPVEDYYADRRARDGRQGTCSRCQRARNASDPAHLRRNRARQRASGALVRAHREEYQLLYARCMAELLAEDAAVDAERRAGS
jgi:hypothetical protein